MSYNTSVKVHSRLTYQEAAVGKAEELVSENTSRSINQFLESDSK